MALLIIIYTNTLKWHFSCNLYRRCSILLVRFSSWRQNFHLLITKLSPCQKNYNSFLGTKNTAVIFSFKEENFISQEVSFRVKSTDESSNTESKKSLVCTRAIVDHLSNRYLNKA